MSNSTNPEVKSEAPEHCYVVTITYYLNGSVRNSSWGFNSNLSGTKLHNYIIETIIPQIFINSGLTKYEFPNWSFVNLIDFGVNT